MKLRSAPPGALRVSARSLAPVIIIALTGLLSSNAEAGYRSWSKRDGSKTIEAELERFDFDAKKIVCRDRDGGEHRFATLDLDTSSRIQVLLSPEFIRSFPNEGFSREQGRFVLLAVAIPALFLLMSFFLCAGILFRSFNPIRAVIGWVGSVVLGGFLAGFYVFLSARSPGAAMGISLFGVIVVSGLLSLYVSIIYRTTVLKSLKVLVLHFFGAAFLIFCAVLWAKFGADPTETEAFLQERIFKPVGLT